MSDSPGLFNGNFSLEILAISYESLQLTRPLPDCFYSSITYSRESQRMLSISFLDFFFFFLTVCSKCVNKLGGGGKDRLAGVREFLECFCHEFSPVM